MIYQTTDQNYTDKTKSTTNPYKNDIPRLYKYVNKTKNIYIQQQVHVFINVINKIIYYMEYTIQVSGFRYMMTNTYVRIQLNLYCNLGSGVAMSKHPLPRIQHPPRKNNNDDNYSTPCILLTLELRLSLLTLNEKNTKE